MKCNGRSGGRLCWQYTSAFKFLNRPPPGTFNLPRLPRFAQGAFPVSSIKITYSTYEIHSDCNTLVNQSLGHVLNEVWGPYSESLGGGLPNNLETLVISYRYSCDSNYLTCGDKEEFHVGKPYGLVKWQHQKLQTDGTYAAPDNVTYFNQVVAGQTQVLTTCFLTLQRFAFCSRLVRSGCSFETSPASPLARSAV